MKTQSILAKALAIISLSTASALAATMSASSTAPVVDGADIANFGDVSSTDKWFLDAARGQSITTGGAAVRLKSITYQVSEGNGAAPTKGYTLRIGKITGTNFTQVHSETATQNFEWTSEQYMTWTFSTPVLLEPYTTYGIDVGMTSSSGSWQTGIPYINVTADDYAGGTSYTSGASGIGTNAVTSSISSDRVFHLDMEAPLDPLFSLVAPTPADNTTDAIATRDLVMTFSQNVSAGTGNLTIRNLTDNIDTLIPAGDSRFTYDQNVVRLNPAGLLSWNKAYAIRIDAGMFLGTASAPISAISDDTTWNFTTLASDPLLAAIAAIKAHVNNTTPLTGPQVSAHKTTIDNNRQRFAENTTIINAVFDLITTYDTIKKPLFVSGFSTNATSFDRNVTTGTAKNSISPENYHWVIYTVMQHAMDLIYTADNLAKYEATLAPYKLGSHTSFPGPCTPPVNPLNTHTVSINGSFPATFGRHTQMWTTPARKPTGAYLAPGTIATVTVPAALVNAGYKIRVGGHAWDLSTRRPVNRLERATRLYAINSTTTKVANPYGGGIYIEVPYLANAGVVSVTVTGGVRSPYFSAKSFHTTTASEWDTEKTHPAPWVDFQSEKFMVQVPRKWIYNMTGTQAVQLMVDWDKAMDAINDLMGFDRNRGKETMYCQTDVILRSSVHAPGYPAVNVTSNVNSEVSPAGYAGNYLVRGPATTLTAANIEFHEQGHAFFFPKFGGESESNVNLLQPAMLYRGFGKTIDEAQNGSFGGGNSFVTVDTTAIAWMTVFSFSPNEIPMQQLEKQYQHKGHAKWMDIARIYATPGNPNAGWEKLDAYWRSFMQDDANNVPYGNGTDDYLLRLSRHVGKDIRPLFHFWGIHPQNQSTLAAALAAENLTPDPAIKAKLLHYKSIVPANNTAFRAFAMSWWGRKPLISGAWEETDHAMQWDETLDADAGPAAASVRPTVTTGSMYVEGCAAEIRARIDELIDQYFPTGMTPATMSFAVEPTPLNPTSVTMKAVTVTAASPPVQYFFTNTTNSTDSGWISTPTWTQTGLTTDQSYSYKVKARDVFLVENNESPLSTVNLTSAGDVTPPSPGPMTFAIAPAAVDEESITMTATTAFDVNGAEYYFENITNFTNSGWQDSPVYTEINLQPLTSYTYRVRARDKSPGQNTTTFSANATASTADLPDETSPVLTGLSPADGSLVSNLGTNLVATFDEPIIAASGSITLKNLTDASETVFNIGDPAVTITGNTLTLNPPANLLYGKDYAVQISSNAVSDLSNNPFAGIIDDTTWSFTAILADPIANPGGPYAVPLLASLSLNGSASAPSHLETISAYDWDLNNDGIYGDVTGVTPAAITEAVLISTWGMNIGLNTIGLRVTDTAAKTATATTTVKIGITLTWDANGSTANQTDGAGAWLDASKWWDDGANATWTSGATATFGNGGVGGAVTLASPTTVASLTFNSYITTGYTLGTAGQTITLNNGITKNAGGVAATIISPITLGGTQTWTNNSAGVLQISNFVTTSSGQTLTLTGTGQFNFPTTTTGITGGGSIVVDGAFLNLISGGNQAVNSYTGTTTVQNGGYILHYANNIGTGNITLNGGYLDGYFNSGFTRNFGTGSNQFQITGGISGFGTNGNGNINLGGVTEVQWGSASFSPSQFLLGSVTSSAGTTTFQDGIDLNGVTRTFTGASTINAGAVSGVIRTSSGTAGLIKTGVGTLTLSGANTFNGVITVNGGTLGFSGNANVASANPLGQSSAAAANLLLANGTTLLYSGTAASTDRSFTINGTAAGHGASLNASGTGAINFTNTATPAYGTVDQTRTLTLTGNNTGNNTLAALIADNGSAAVSLTKSGTGTWFLGNAGNSYTGPTTLAGGSLQGNIPGGIATAGGMSALIFNGGILGLTGDFTRSLDSNTTVTAANFTGAGGWAAYGADRNVNLGGASAQIVWATPNTGFNAQTLILGASTATHKVTLQNGLDLGTAIRTVQTDDGAALVDGELSGIVTGGAGGGLTKTGTGVLSLSNANTYSGVTTVSGGVLRLDNTNALPGGIGNAGGTSNLTFNGGVVGLATGDFTRSLNTVATASATTFTGAGGWAAFGADRIVNLGGASAPITWATANTGFNNQTLILGHATATHMVDLQNPLVVTAARTVQVDNGSASIDAKLSGAISGAAGNITKTGSGALWISGNMSNTGGLTINTGTVTLSGTNTYSGATNFNGAGTLLVFAGTQAVSPNTSFVMNINASTADSSVKLLDDTGGVNGSTVSVPNTFTKQNNNAPGNASTFIVGNNNTTNGGTSSGTTTGSTIAIGTLNWNTYAANTAAYGPIQIQGSNSYRLQINSVVLHNAANLASNVVGSTFFTPTTANVTLGTVTVGTGNVNLGIQNLTLDGTSSDNRITGTISNASDFGTSNRALNVTKSNSSTWTLSGTNTYSGTTTIAGGNLIINSIKNVGGAANSLGQPLLASSTISIGSTTTAGTLTYTGTGDTTDRVLNLAGTTGGVTLDQSGASGLLKFTSPLTATGAGIKTLTLTGSTAGTGEISAAIVENSSTNKTSLAKSGTGTWLLSGTNTYTGTTAINTGKLFINGSTGAGAVNVAADATLGGTGVIGGNTTIAATGKLEFDISTPAAGHNKLELANTKTLTFSGASVLTITSSGGAATGNYTLLTAPGGISGVAPATLNLPSNWVATVSKVGNDLVLNVTSTGITDPYATWSGGAAFGADANNDGVDNGMAFLLGAANPGTNAIGLLPTTTQNSGNLILTFNCLPGSERGTAILQVQHSSDIGMTDTWTGAPVPGTVGTSTVNGIQFTVTDPGAAGGPLNVVATIQVGGSASGKLFGRLRSTPN